MKTLAMLTFIFASAVVQAQQKDAPTVADQILKLTKTDKIDHVTVARLGIVAEAMKYEEPFWHKIVGQAEQIPSLALLYLPARFTGDGLHLDYLNEMKREIAESLSYQQARNSKERTNLRVYWSFGPRGEHHVLVHAPLLQSIIHSYLVAKDEPNAERIFKAEFQRLTAIMSSMHEDLSNLRVNLMIEKGPEELWQSMRNRAPIVRAAAFLRGERVRAALGTLLEPVTWILAGSHDSSLRVTNWAMSRFTAINALGDLPGDPENKAVDVIQEGIPPGLVEACFLPFTKGHLN